MTQDLKSLFIVLFFTFFFSLVEGQEKIPVEKCHQFLQGVPVNCMQSNDVNMLWVGTNMGLYVFNYFEGVRTIMEEGAVTALTSDDKGYMWCSLSGGEVVSADKTKRFKVGEGHVEIKSMQILDHKIWLGTASKGVYVWDMKTLEISAHYQSSNSDLPSDEVNFLFKDGTDNMWIGTNEGLAIISRNKWAVQLEEQEITAISAYDGKVWLAGDGFLWNTGNVKNNQLDPIKVERELIRGRVKGMSFDDNGRLYLASDIFARYDSEERTTFVYDADFGFKEKNLLCVGKDMNGDMWTGTLKNGLFRFKIFFEEPPKEALVATIKSEKKLACHGDQDGSLLLNVRGGVGPYGYQWNHKDCKGESPKNLGVGEYEVTITDTEGTEIIVGTEVLSTNPISIDVEKVKCVSREGGRDGELVIKARGGEGRFTYTWSDNRRTSMRRGLKEGCYIVTVTDVKGCTMSKKLIVSEPRIIPELEPEMLEEGQIITLKELFFDADSLSFTEASLPALKEIDNFLKENPSISIEIGGHTNGLPNHEYCDWLSAGRAEKVAEYFYDLGIKSEQLSYKGYGKRKAIASNTTVQGRNKNQRVEIKIISIAETE